LFVASVVALALTEAWIFVRFRERASATVIAALGGSLIGAKVIGGFFVAASYPPAGGLFGTGFYLRDYFGSDALLGQIQWNLASFGVLLIPGNCRPASGEDRETVPDDFRDRHSGHRQLPSLPGYLGD